MLFIQIVINTCMLVKEKDYFMVTKYEIILEIKAFCVYLKFDLHQITFTYIFINLVSQISDIVRYFKIS